MKHLIFIIGSLAIFASAELPANIPDQKVRDSVEYVDGKANKAYSVTRQFESATSTVSVSGWIDVGWERVVNNCGGAATTCTATCSAGKKISGGGCDTNLTQYLQTNTQNSDTTQLCRIAPAATLIATAICYKAK